MVGDLPGSGRKLFILILVLTLDLLSFTCILPLFPSIIEYYSRQARLPENGGDVVYEYFESSAKWLQSIVYVPDLQRYNTVFFAGIIGSLFSFLQYLSSPILGALSDVYGRKPILILSILGSLASYYLWSIADTFGVFIVSRIVGGLSKASVSVAIAVVTDICPISSRGKGMAFVGIAFSCAFIIGPAIGAYFAASAAAAVKATTDNIVHLNTAPAKFALFVTFLELVLALLFLPETLTKPRMKLREIVQSTYNYIHPKALFEFKVVGKENNKLLRCYGQIYFYYLFLYSGLEFTLCFLTHIRFQYGSSQQGKLYLFTGVLMVILQGIFAGFVRRIPLDRQQPTALLGLAAITPAFLLMSMAFNETLLYISLALFSCASAIVVPCLTTLVSAQCDESKKGSCMGVFRSIGALSRACGPIFGSLMFWLMGPTMCYLIGGILLVIPFLLMKRINNETSNSVKTV
uniref:Major facilitator superfamily (MFS) profile domain-containing protein n=1 Tax=Ditylenchus dipsaci TaxID=166011 RepID=A0A915EPB9_9BILA